jgi:hypothetical protein
VRGCERARAAAGGRGREEDRAGGGEGGGGGVPCGAASTRQPTTPTGSAEKPNSPTATVNSPEPPSSRAGAEATVFPRSCTLISYCGCVESECTRVCGGGMHEGKWCVQFGRSECASVV